MNFDTPNSGQLCSDTHSAITAGTTKNTAMNSTLGSTNSSPACRRADIRRERGLPRSSARSSVAIASSFSSSLCRLFSLSRVKIACTELAIRSLSSFLRTETLLLRHNLRYLLLRIVDRPIDVAVKHCLLNHRQPWAVGVVPDLVVVYRVRCFAELVHCVADGDIARILLAVLIVDQILAHR